MKKLYIIGLLWVVVLSGCGDPNVLGLLPISMREGVEFLPSFMHDEIGVLPYSDLVEFRFYANSIDSVSFGLYFENRSKYVHVRFADFDEQVVEYYPSNGIEKVIFRNFYHSGGSTHRFSFSMHYFDTDSNTSSERSFSFRGIPH